MKKLASVTEIEPKEGSTRLRRKFAWRPTYVGGFIVWLEFFEILEVYHISLRNSDQGTFKVGSWKYLDNRTLG